jgi:hypothetical protein
MDCWIVGLLDCLIVGLLDCLIVGLLDGWDCLIVGGVKSQYLSGWKGGG